MFTTTNEIKATVYPEFHIEGEKEMYYQTPVSIIRFSQWDLSPSLNFLKTYLLCYEAWESWFDRDTLEQTANKMKVKEFIQKREVWPNAVDYMLSKGCCFCDDTQVHKTIAKVYRGEWSKEENRDCYYMYTNNPHVTTDFLRTALYIKYPWIQKYGNKLKIYTMGYESNTHHWEIYLDCLTEEQHKDKKNFPTTCLYIPVDALCKMDIMGIFKRHTTYHAHYYNTNRARDEEDKKRIQFCLQQSISILHSPIVEDFFADMTKELCRQGTIGEN